MGTTAREEQVQIQGYVLSTDFDRHGKILDITLETEDFQQYGIVHNTKGKELFNYILKQVIVKGILETKEDAHPIISIQEYEIVS